MIECIWTVYVLSSSSSFETFSFASLDIFVRSISVSIFSREEFNSARVSSNASVITEDLFLTCSIVFWIWFVFSSCNWIDSAVSVVPCVTSCIDAIVWLVDASSIFIFSETIPILVASCFDAAMSWFIIFEICSLSCSMVLSFLSLEVLILLALMIR